MPVKKDPDGRRSVQAEVEVPGTPEEVWAAIATGSGISSWFVPTTVEEHEGGAANSNFGPGMESLATIRTWEPPHRFVADTTEGPGTVATEWIVEARAGGKCVVRVVHSWFADTDDWDDQFVGHTHGWQSFFRILRLYLAHFSGQPCTSFQLLGTSATSLTESWATLMQSLGWTPTAPGRQLRTAEGPPPLTGTIEQLGAEAHPELLLRLDAPAPGLAHLFAMPLGRTVLLSIRLFLYGDQAAQVAAQHEPAWGEWLAGQFPSQQG